MGQGRREEAWHRVLWVCVCAAMASVTTFARSTYLGKEVAVRGKAKQVQVVGKERNRTTTTWAKAVVKRNFEGKEQGNADFELPTAGEQTAKGLVHRYLVYRQQNARRVRRTRNKERKINMEGMETGTRGNQTNETEPPTNG